MQCKAEMGSKTTLATCSRETCQGCEIEGKLSCIHTTKDMASIMIPTAGFSVPFFIGMIRGGHRTALRIWLGLVAIFFGYAEEKMLCSHCPQYAEEGFLLKCYSHWGFPKIPDFNPKPISNIEKGIWLVWLGAIALYHIPFFIMRRQWLFLVVTTCAAIFACWTVYHTHCDRCPNLSCLANHVPDEVREAFLKNNPVLMKAYE